MNEPPEALEATMTSTAPAALALVPAQPENLSENVNAAPSENAVVTSALNKLREGTLSLCGTALDPHETAALARLLGVVDAECTTLVDGRLRYALRTSLDEAGGGSAVLRDRLTQREHTVIAGTRVALLHVLATAQRNGQHVIEREDAAVGVWGRKGAHDTNGLHVLVCRVRQELERHGFAPWIVHTRPNAIGLRGVEVEQAG